MKLRLLCVISLITALAAPAFGQEATAATRDTTSEIIYEAPGSKQVVLRTTYADGTQEERSARRQEINLLRDAQKKQSTIRMIDVTGKLDDPSDEASRGITFSNFNRIEVQAAQARARPFPQTDLVTIDLPSGKKNPLKRVTHADGSYNDYPVSFDEHKIWMDAYRKDPDVKSVPLRADGTAISSRPAAKPSAGTERPDISSDPSPEEKEEQGCTEERDIDGNYSRSCSYSYSKSWKN